MFAIVVSVWWIEKVNVGALEYSRFLFAMDKGWTQLHLFVIFLLFLSNAHGFKAGAHSDANHWWGQPSDKSFSPRAVQSSVSEVPVTGILPEEVGSSLFTNRPLKRLNLLQFVKGGVSSRHESMSHAQTTPSSSVLASLPVPLNELHAGHLTSLQGSSGSAATDTTSVSTQGESSFPATLGNSGLSTSDQSSPSLYVTSSLETSGALGQYNPGSYNELSSSSVSSPSTSDQSTPSLYSSSFQGNSGSFLEASGSFQGEVAGLGSHVDLFPQSQDRSSQLLPSPLEVSSQSTNGQSTPSLFMLGSDSSSGSQSAGPASPLDTQGSLSQSISSQSTSVQSSPSVSTSTQSRSATPLTSSNLFPVQGGSSSTSSLYLKPQGTLGRYAPASHTKYASIPMSSHLAIYSQSKSTSGPWFEGSTGFASQGMSSTYSGSVQSQGTTSQFASGSPSSYPIVTLSSPQGSASQSATAQSSWKQFASRYGTQSGSSKPITLQGSTYGGSLEPQGTTSQFASGSQSYPSVSLSSPQGSFSQSAAVQGSRKQFAFRYGTQLVSSKPITLQGSKYGGSLQPQGTTSQFASGSPSYPSESHSSPQGSSSQSAAIQSSRKQFASRYGTQSGSSKPFTLQGSTTDGGSLQPQGTTSQFASGSLSYPSASLSSPQGSSSQSAAVHSSQKQFSSSYGTQSGSSKPFTLQGSTYGGSLQPQGTTSPFASGSQSYPSASLSLPQGSSSQSAAVQSSRKQFASSYGTQLVSSKPITLQGSKYGGSLQPQGTTSQFASGSPSYPSQSHFSPQGSSSQSAAIQSSQKQFASRYGTQLVSSKPITLQGSTTDGGSLQPQGTTSQFASGSLSYPSASLSSPQGSSSQSAAVQSSQKQFASRYGTQLVSSKPITLQGSTYGGSLQPQGTTSPFASGSQSYPSASLSLPQGSSSQSAAVQSSRKQFASSYGTQLVSSKPITLRGSKYGGSLQPQGTTSQFASGSPSYPSQSHFSPQGSSSQSAAIQSSQKQFASRYGTQLVSSKPITLQGSTYGGSLQPQGTTSQFASGSQSYPSVSLSSPQGSSSQSAAVQGSRKQFAFRYGTQLVSSKPITLQGSTSGGSFQPQGTTSQFASGSQSYPSESLSSPQGSASQSAAVQSSQKQFASRYGTQLVSSKPITLQGSKYGGSLQPQGTTSQFASGSPSYPSESHSLPQGSSSQSAAIQSSQKQFTSRYGTHSGSSKPFTLQGSTTDGGSLQPQGVADQSGQAVQSYSGYQSQKSQRWQPSQGIHASGGAASWGSSLSQSSPMQSFFSSLSSAGGSSSAYPGPFVSAQGGSSRHGGISLHSQSPSRKYTPGSHAYAMLGSSPLAVSSQSTSDKWSNGLYRSDSLGTQGLIGVIERPSRLSSQAPNSTSSNQISEHFGTMKRPTGSNLTPSLGLSALESSVGMFYSIPQTAHALRNSGSDVQLNNKPFLNQRYSVKG
ncbi:hornerin-like isoform X2 [Pimephales promelas]|uniref:hornerin-like isoform X2 n=1 Tax=Pimephales promelas TaxID=90988 RepID=UPI001955A509|nr:hornerin-like isoform X2 [Pimephales promelas]